MTSENNEDLQPSDVLYFNLPVQFTRLSKSEDDKDDDEDEKYTAVLMNQTVIPKHFRMADGSYADEVLLTDGGRFPKRVPLNDNHDESTIRSTLGYVDGIRKEGRDMLGDVFVSKAHPDVRQKVKDGTIPAVSIGMKPRSGGAKFIAEGKARTYGDFVVNGPAVVYTDWDLQHVALTAAPANQQAKIRLSLLNTLVTNDEEILNPLGDPMDEVTHKVEPTETKTFAEAPDVKAIRAEALETHRKYVADVRSECKQFNLPSDVADEITAKFDNLTDARKAILDTLATRQKSAAPAPSVTITSEGSERRFEAQRDAFTYSMMKHLHWERPDTAEKVLPKNVDEQLANFNFASHARYILVEEQGNRLARYWNDSKCVGAALGTMRFNQSPYVTSGSLSNLLSDAINKIAVAAYQDAIVTYDQVFKQLPSQNNLKNAYAIRLSGLGFMDVWIEGTQPMQKGLVDAKQALKMVPWSNDLIVPWHVLRNDDLGMLADVPMQMGRAARRTLNRECWLQVTGNPTVDEDGLALFDSSHNNFVNANSGTVSSTEINTMQEDMAAQVDLDGVSLLSITGRFLAGPPGKERDIKLACGSEYDPNASVAMIPNVYRSQLTPVIEPLLGQNSQVIYYLLTDKMSSPVVYTFLTDEETPVVYSFVDQHDSSLHIVGRQTFATAASDFRGIVKHA